MLRDSLAAVLRLVRAARGLTKEDFQSVLDPKHIYNVENARSGMTLETLEAHAKILEVDLLTLLILAASLDRGVAHDDLLKQLNIEAKQLNAFGLSADWPGQFQDGVLIAMPSGRRTPPETIDAILACRVQGMTQKQTANQLGISTSVVNRIWNRPVPS